MAELVHGGGLDSLSFEALGWTSNSPPRAASPSRTTTIHCALRRTRSRWPSDRWPA